MVRTRGTNQSHSDDELTFMRQFMTELQNQIQVLTDTIHNMNLRPLAPRNPDAPGARVEIDSDEREDRNPFSPLNNRNDNWLVTLPTMIL